MNFEFKVNIKKTYVKQTKNAQHYSGGKLKIALILAHQISKYIEDNQLTFAKAGKLFNMSTARISQINKLTFLAPQIQKQILLDSNFNIKRLTERKILAITKELLWSEQLKKWNNYHM